MTSRGRRLPSVRDAVRGRAERRREPHAGEGQQGGCEVGGRDRDEHRRRKPEGPRPGLTMRAGWAYELVEQTMVEYIQTPPY